LFIAFAGEPGVQPKIACTRSSKTALRARGRRADRASGADYYLLGKVPNAPPVLRDQRAPDEPPVAALEAVRPGQTP